MLSNSWVKYISNIEFYIHPTENEDRDRVKICSEIQDFKNTYVLFHCLVAQSCPTVCNPWTVAHQAPLSVGFASKNAGVGCHFLLQGLFPTQGLNPCLLHWQEDSLLLSHQGSPGELERTLLWQLEKTEEGLYGQYYFINIEFLECDNHTAGL